jgi:hypothetical protein
MGQQRPGHAHHLVGERHRHDLEGSPRQELRNDRRSRERTSGENLLLLCLLIGSASQELEPPANPKRFIAPLQPTVVPREPGRTFRVYELLLVGFTKGRGLWPNKS